MVWCHGSTAAICDVGVSRRGALEVLMLASLSSGFVGGVEESMPRQEYAVEPPLRRSLSPFGSNRCVRENFH